MQTKVLCRVMPDDPGWKAFAFESREGAFAVEQGADETEAIERLLTKVQAILDTHGRAWVDAMKHGGNPDAPNCPEGAVQLPIDAWVCKLMKTNCPLQAQVLLNEPDVFFEECLAPAKRAQDIFETVRSGKYDGFHHVPGRYLCVDCDEEQIKTTFKYHYPWELVHIEDFLPFSLEMDRPLLRQILKIRGLNPLSANNALCTRHALALAQDLEPKVAAEVVVLEFEFNPR